MKAHLIECLERQEMSMFPIKKRRRTEFKVKTVDEIPIYCICRMPELPNSAWIECSSCKEWYHSDTCVKVPPKYCTTKALWHCGKCKSSCCMMLCIIITFPAALHSYTVVTLPTWLPPAVVLIYIYIYI